MKTYDFDEIIDRTGTDCVKYDSLPYTYGNAAALPMWVADTDFRVPDFITDAIRDRMAHEILAYSYRPDSYFDAIINWMKREHDWEITKEMITFSPGVVSGVTMSILAYSEPGDKVIVQPPVYFPFFTCVNGTDRVMVENPLIIRDGRYTFDFENLRQNIDSKTKLLILCSPHNPGGMVWTKEELEELSSICAEHGIKIISDEIHCDLVFNGYKHLPVPKISKIAAKNSLVLMAPSKTFNVAGLSSAIAIIPDRNMRVKYERVLNTIHIHGGNIFGNMAIEAAFKHGHDWHDQLMAYLEENYRFLEAFMKERLPKIKVMKPEATFLVWLDFSAYNLNERKLAKILIDGGIALNNGSKFGTGGEGYFRLNFGCPKSTLEKGLLILEKALNNF